MKNEKNIFGIWNQRVTSSWIKDSFRYTIKLSQFWSYLSNKIMAETTQDEMPSPQPEVAPMNSTCRRWPWSLFTIILKRRKRALGWWQLTLITSTCYGREKYAAQVNTKAPKYLLGLLFTSVWSWAVRIYCWIPHSG